MTMRRAHALWMVVGCVLLLTACKDRTRTASEDIVTQKVTASDQTQVTVLVKYAFSIHAFEQAAEAKFPELDIIQVGNYTCDMGIAEYEARMEHNDLTDVVMTWPLEVGAQYWPDRLIDLSACPFTENYVTSMLDNIARKGKLYYLPGPSQIRGIVYNQTLFQEKGWKVPTDFESFLALCQTIEASGMRALQLGLGNSEVLDTAFVGYGYESSFSEPKNAQWLADYNQGKGSFGDHFLPALHTFQRLIDTGVLKPEDLTIRYADRERMLFTRECAMVEDSVLVARMGYDYNGCTDTFALMPFFNEGTEGDWVRLYPVCYIGVNRQLNEPQNKEKRELVMRLLEYISTPEGQLALAGDIDAAFSSLKGTMLPDVFETRDLIPALTHGRYAVFPTLRYAQDALRQGLAGMVEGQYTSADVVKMVDQANLVQTPAASPLVLGRAEKDFTLMETGAFLTDVMCTETGCEIALFLDNGKDGRFNGKGISGRWYEGDVTDADIRRVLPDLKLGEKGELWKITMTGANLLQTLEYAMPINNNRDGWFYYFSGLRMKYAPAAAPGSRIREITDANGEKIEMDKRYTIAVMDESVPELLIESCEETGISIYTMLEEVISQKGTISPTRDGRFIVVK